MKFKRKTFLFVFSMFLNANNAAAYISKMPISSAIYGHDDRYDVELYPDSEIAELAHATAGQVATLSLKKNYNGDYDFDLTSAGKKKMFCPEERFYNQTSVAACSGFLVAPNLLVTAGHCMREQGDCKNFKWVFGYNKGSVSFKQSQIYSCKKIIASKESSTIFHTADFAIIELDRAVKNVRPLEIRTEGRAHAGDRIAVIGHPSGLPTKIIDGEVSKWDIIEKITFPFALIRRVNYFTANVDTYAGNSGSAVINMSTKKVEGILVSGANDYKFDTERLCRYSVKYSNNEDFVFEKVIKIKLVKRFLDKILNR